MESLKRVVKIVKNEENVKGEEGSDVMDEKFE